MSNQTIGVGEAESASLGSSGISNAVSGTDNGGMDIKTCFINSYCIIV